MSRPSSVRRTGWPTRWTSSLLGAARCRTSSWRGSVPGCRASTIEARRHHRTRRTRHRAVSRPGCLRRHRLGHPGERRAGSGRAAAAQSGAVGVGEMSAHPRACARGQSHRGVRRGTPRSQGKDSTTGHWEICGVILERPFRTYPHGFPTSLLDEFAWRTGRGYLGNRAASGTAIIAELGAEHQRTGKWIVYTSADSVFQVAAHEETVGLDELYRACAIARDVLVGEHAVSGVIARPFAGKPGAYERTPRRKDFSIEPVGTTLLDRLAAAGVPRVGIGKVDDLFAGR